MNPLAVRVARKTWEASDICRVELVRADGGALPAFSAGAHIDVHIADGLIRQYSLCNCVEETHRYVLGVLKEPQSRGGSQTIHDRVQEGDVLTVSAPKNHFPLARAAHRHVLFAGGIGITPLLCMAKRLSSIQADFVLHYCTRSQTRTAFYEDLIRSAFASRVQFHFDDGAPAQKLNLAEQLAQAEPGVHLYVCGPKGFMDAVLHTARAADWAEAQLHYEFFANTPTASAANGSFQIQLASSGQILTVAAEQSAVDVLIAAGVPIETSCRQGVCGTCLTRVLEGEIDHRDLYLTPQEQAANNQFTPCCSRAKSALLVLDL